MKLLVYITPIFFPEERGVINKINSQKKALLDLGVNVHLMQMGLEDRENNLESESKVYVFPAGQKKTPRSISAYRKLITYVVNKLKELKPDYIYIRDRMFFFNLYSKLAAQAPVFVEIQSKIIQEMRNISKMRWVLEKFLARKYLKKVTGFIAVTNEILEYEKEFNKKPGMVIGNGINPQDIQFIKHTPTNNKINLLFMGSAGMAWHGLDRLLQSFAHSKNQEKFLIHIVGYDNSFEIENPSIRFYGYIKDKEKINEIIAGSDIGIASLAMFRNNLNEGATLKFRHYLGSGLPVITGYRDVDCPNTLPFIMEFPNNESDLDFDKIESFYQQCVSIRKSGEITKFAAEHLTWKNKMNQVWSFITDPDSDWNR